MRPDDKDIQDRSSAGAITDPARLVELPGWRALPRFRSNQRSSATLRTGSGRPHAARRTRTRSAQALDRVALGRSKQPVTLGHIGGHGCRDILIYCASINSSHDVTMNADAHSSSSPAPSARPSGRDHGPRARPEDALHEMPTTAVPMRGRTGYRTSSSGGLCAWLVDTLAVEIDGRGAVIRRTGHDKSRLNRNPCHRFERTSFLSRA